MTIYAKKNPHGKPTGLWVVEVIAVGRRTCETTGRHATALAREASLKAGDYTPPSADLEVKPLPYTVGGLLAEAVVVWRDTKDERRSVARFGAPCVRRWGLLLVWTRCVPRIGQAG